MKKTKNGKKKKLEFDIPKSKEGNGIKKRINTEGEDAKALDSLANSIGNIIDKKEFKLGERTNLLLRKNSDEKKTEEIISLLNKKFLSYEENIINLINNIKNLNF